MKKNYFSLLLALLISAAANAYNAYVDGIYYNFSGSEASVTYKVLTEVNFYTGNVVIPSSVTYGGKYYRVTSIGDHAFDNCSGVTSITIVNNVTSIGKYVFSQCTGLTSIIIPNSVKTIGEAAFSGCRGLTSINVPNSVTTIEKSAFNGCTSLTTFTIPNSVASIANQTFFNCSSLTSITIPNSVTSIGSNAFYGCTCLSSVTIPGSVTSIGDQAFSKCTNLTSIQVEDNNSVFDSRDNCNAIIETTTNKLIAGCKNTIIPNSVTSIGYYSFNWCTGLTSITIPESVISIEQSAFTRCEGLTSITIPNSVTSIGAQAFSFCIKLTSVTIGNSVTSIGNQAFTSCDKLTSVTINLNIPLTITAYTFTSQTYATLYVPYGSKAAYQAADYWKSFKEIIEMEAPSLICATPVLTYQNGKIHCTCETEGVKYVYSIAPIPTTGESTDGIIELGTEFRVSVYATRDGYEDSEPATITIDLASVGDMNGDGTISIADVTGLVNVILGK